MFKKLLAMSVIGIMIGLLAACGGTDNASSDSDSKSNSTETEKPKEEVKEVYFKDNEAKLNDLK
ncbi:hypothetical protein PBF_24748, partial [Cytobacillus firmus DS1]